ncbi:hypothetical protein E2C01_062759 [Portunus trituberculatus]|uniref:Uncharacterized protein n=1 Tax=Portunus trituberculatus TaxID=210409 RepID=A0A5B7HGY1_PORTR|nr:hypothetical protein [Portunus trituberculatus]
MDGCESRSVALCWRRSDDKRGHVKKASSERKMSVYGGSEEQRCSKQARRVAAPSDTENATLTFIFPHKI